MIFNRYLIRQTLLARIGICIVAFAAISSASAQTVVTLGGNLTLSGAFSTTLLVTGTTAVTFPTSGTLATLSGTETFSNKTITSPTLTGESSTAVSLFGLRDTSAAFDVTLAASSSVTLTAGQSLTFDVANGSRVLKLTGDSTLNQNVSTSGTPSFNTITSSGGLATVGTGAQDAHIFVNGEAEANHGAYLYLEQTGTVIGGITRAAVWETGGSASNDLAIAAGSGNNIRFFVNNSTTAAGAITPTGLNSVAIGATTPSTGAFSTLNVQTGTPASSSATGIAGAIEWDSSYLYVCTATNTWKRVAIATW
jgi:hypothetical protein